MAFVAIAIGGSAAIGAGTSIYGGMLQSKAASNASNAQQAAINQSIQTQREGKSESLNYLDPFRQYGLNAGSTLQSLLYSPQQLAAQQGSERTRLQSELEGLKAKELSVPEWVNLYGKQYRGKKWRQNQEQAYSRFNTGLQQQIQEAQQNLTAFDKQAEVQQQSAGQAQDIQASPWYQFQAQLLGRDQDRYFAARGLTGSGFESEQRQRSLIELGAGETERQFNRLKGMYDVGANASNVGAGTITNTSQSIANSQVAGGQAEAQGYMNKAAANANMVAGVANSVTGAVGAGLNAYQFNQLIKMNQGSPPGGAQRRDPVYDSGDSGSYPGSSYGYLDKTYGPPNPYG